MIKYIIHEIKRISKNIIIILVICCLLTGILYVENVKNQTGIIISLKTLSYITNKTFTTTKNDVIRQKIVRYNCDYFCGGWADRLKGIMGAYAWSIITGRKLQIDIVYPCNMINVIKPNEIDWYVSSEEKIMEEKLNLTIQYLNAVDDFNTREMIKEIDIRQYMNDTDIIIIRNNLDWLLHFSMSSIMESRIRELGFEPKLFRTPYLFRMIYNKLFKLIPRLQERYETFKKVAKPNGEKSKLICIQFRVWYAKRNNTDRFWDFVNKTFISNISKNEDYKIFLTTDRYNVEDEAIEVFGKERMVRNDGMYKHMDRGEPTPDNCTGVEKVLLDFHSLQLCDMAVVSDSGFGKLGVWNRENPDKNLYIFRSTGPDEFDFIKMNMDDDSIIL